MVANTPGSPLNMHYMSEECTGKIMLKKTVLSICQNYDNFGNNKLLRRTRLFFTPGT